MQPHRVPSPCLYRWLSSESVYAHQESSCLFSIYTAIFIQNCISFTLKKSCVASTKTTASCYCTGCSVALCGRGTLLLCPGARHLDCFSKNTAAQKENVLSARHGRSTRIKASAGQRDPLYNVCSTLSLSHTFFLQSSYFFSLCSLHSSPLILHLLSSLGFSVGKDEWVKYIILSIMDAYCVT